MFENRNKLESTIHIPLKEKRKGLIKKKKKKNSQTIGEVIEASKCIYIPKCNASLKISSPIIAVSRVHNGLNAVMKTGPFLCKPMFEDNM